MVTGYVVEAERELARCIPVFKTKVSAVTYLKKRRKTLNRLFGKGYPFIPKIIFVLVKNEDIIDDSEKTLLASKIEVVKEVRYEEFMDGGDTDESKIINDAASVRNIFE